MSDIPPEIIRGILSHLPVKSLLRFRCVSKPWRSMIDAKDFVKLHLQTSYRTNSNRTLVVDSVNLYLIDLDSFERLEVAGAEFEPQCVASCCDGLVLLVFGYDNVVLWNPALRKSNKLPGSLQDYRVPYSVDCVQERYGLGYDTKRDDYKVVRVMQTIADDGRCLSSETMIYSLKSNSWKRVEDFPYLVAEPRWGGYLNDALHTVVKNSKGSEVIMAFDLVNEKHYEVPRPGGVRGLDNVAVMRGRLTVVVPGKKNMSEVWVMREYGVKESWVRLLRFKPPISGRCLNLCPLAYSKKGDEVLLNYDGMCLDWYNLRRKSVSIACVPGLTASFNASPSDPLFHAEFCVGSLVSPLPKKGIVAKKKRDEFLSSGFKLKL